MNRGTLNMDNYKGLPELREWLIHKGFKIDLNPLSRHNDQCNWLAVKKIESKARKCESNGKISLFINSYSLVVDDNIHTRFKVEIRGEYKRLWYDLNAYALTENEFKTNLREIETSLINAWNGLSGDYES